MNAPAELLRRLDNLIRLGTVAAVDHGRALCRVQSGRLTTDWLPWLDRRAGTTRTWSPPTPGEQVVVFCPSGEPAAGVVLTGIYTATHDQPSESADEHVVDFADGARIAYDQDSGTLTITGMQAIRITCPLIEIDGEVRQYGGDLSSHGVVLETHVHTGVVPGGGLSGEPAK